MSVLYVLLGVVLLYLGGEWLIKNAVRLAKSLGLSSMVIGLTVVAFGTSSPELAATMVAAVTGAPAIAIGNVIGSNIANIGLILGLAAILYPLQAKLVFLRREIPIMIGVSGLLFVVVWGGLIGRVEGLLLLAGLAAYLWYLLRNDELPAEELHESEAPGPTWRAVLGAAAGIGLLVLGAQALVTGAVEIALVLGVSERVIGLTVVALGTSLPELASSVVAALRRQGDLILGNIIGSNVFNILAILGTTALVHPIPVAVAAIRIDLWVMFGLSLLVLPLMLPRYRLGRRGGALLLGLYAAYIGYLYLWPTSA